MRRQQEETAALLSETHMGHDGASHSQGDNVNSAVAKIKVAYGQRSSPTFIMNAIGKHGVLCVANA